mgnify:CR=1 FL=1
MNKTDTKSNEFQNESETNIKIDEKNIIDIIKDTYDYDEIKTIVEDKVDFYMKKKYDELSSEYDRKINDLLEIQENAFIKKEMIKQKIASLKNYLKSYCKKNNIDYDSLREK